MKREDFLRSILNSAGLEPELVNAYDIEDRDSEIYPFEETAMKIAKKSKTFAINTLFEYIIGKHEDGSYYFKVKKEVLDLDKG